MGKTGNKGIKRLIAATGYSLKGLKSAWKYEEAFRIECVLALLFIPLALWLGDTAVEKVLLVLSCFLVIFAELINSAIEAVVDRIGDDYHELSGRAKDIGSSLVFIAIGFHIFTWLLLLWPTQASFTL